jgi:hypothetical protein
MQGMSQAMQSNGIETRISGYHLGQALRSGVGGDNGGGIPQ